MAQCHPLLFFNFSFKIFEREFIATTFGIKFLIKINTFEIKNLKNEKSMSHHLMAFKQVLNEKLKDKNI